MTTILIVFTSVLCSALFFVRADLYPLRRGFCPIGTTVFSIYTLTYGFGWLLWRIDPDSLFGYSSRSTLSALNGMGLSFALGIFTLSLVYYLARSLFLPRFSLNLSPADIYFKHSKSLVLYIFIVLTASCLFFPYLSQNGMFSREVDTTSLPLSPALILVTLVKGTALLSRLLPIALILLPLAFANLTTNNKIASVALSGIFLYMGFLTGSRTLLFTVPAYITIGFFFWYRPKFSTVFVLIGLLLTFSIPLAEHLRVEREGDKAIPDLSRKYQLFQIGKQLIGTSHDFYLYTDSASCLADLSTLIENDPLSKHLSQVGVRSIPSDNFMRWHISGRLSACATRKLETRSWSSFSRFPSGLLPKTLGFSSPSLFDGQDLSLELSRSLDLKPGEISNSTLSLFADSWWRFRWLGVIIAFSIFGLFLAFTQTFIDCQISKGAVVGLLSQLLLFTLLGSWINNTALTTLWLLFWELPKTLFTCYLLVALLGYGRKFIRKF